MAPSPRPTTCALSIPSASSRARTSCDAVGDASPASSVGLRAPVDDDAVVAAEVAQLPSVDDLDMRQDRDVEDRLALAVIDRPRSRSRRPAAGRSRSELPIGLPLLVGDERAARRSRPGFGLARRPPGGEVTGSPLAWSPAAFRRRGLPRRKKSRRSALTSSAWVYVMKRPPSKSTVSPWHLGRTAASFSISSTGASGSSSRFTSSVGTFSDRAQLRMSWRLVTGCTEYLWTRI